MILNIRNTSSYPSKNYGITPAMLSFVNHLPNSTKLIFNLFGSPYAVDKFSFSRNLSSLLVGYEDNELVANAIVDILVGNSSPKGKLPVTLKKYKCGFGLEFSGFLSPETLPIALIDNEFTNKIDSIVVDAINQEAMPGCQILAMKDG